MSPADEVLAAADELSDAMEQLSFAPPVAFTYNPLVYARAGHETYIRRFASTTKRALFLGMNPGPFGMAQTGVPFGEIPAVTLWMGITAPIGQPPAMHPKRPVQGFSCPRSEVSGRRLWGLFEELYGSAENFFSQAYVANYCPGAATLLPHRRRRLCHGAAPKSRRCHPGKELRPRHDPAPQSCQPPLQ